MWKIPKQSYTEEFKQAAVKQRLSDTQLLTLIRAIHAQTKDAYGSPRVFRELKDRGIPVSRERVAQLMRKNDIRARHIRRYKARPTRGITCRLRPTCSIAI
jgi:transposase InsO family protein